MVWSTITAVILILAGIAFAAFSLEANADITTWILTGILTALIVIFVVLLLPGTSTPESRARMRRAITGAVVVLFLAALLAVGGAEFWERYENGERYSELDNWAMYGDALLRFTKSNQNPPDAIVVKAAHAQIDDYYQQLRDGKCWTMYDLELAEQGQRRSMGAWALLANAKRLLALHSPEWPAIIAMTADEKERNIKEWNARLGQYNTYMQSIDAARADTSLSNIAN